MGDLRIVRGSIFVELTPSDNVVIGNAHRDDRRSVTIERADIDDAIDALLEARLAMDRPMTASDLMRRIVEAVKRG